MGAYSWGHFTRILAQEGADTWVPSMFFCAVVQAVLRRSKTTVLSTHIVLVLEGAHVRFARGITIISPKRNREGGWDYLPSAGVLKAEGFLKM